MARRLPAPRCVLCDRTLDEIGGKRLVATRPYGVVIRTPHAPLSTIGHSARVIRLEGDFRDVIVAMIGEGIWTDEVVERVRIAVQSGFRPWFCQRCVNRDLCPNCGTPMTAVPGADHMQDDGKVVHSPTFAGQPNVRYCPNPICHGGN